MPMDKDAVNVFVFCEKTKGTPYFHYGIMDLIPDNFHTPGVLLVPEFVVVTDGPVYDYIVTTYLNDIQVDSIWIFNKWIEEGYWPIQAHSNIRWTKIWYKNRPLSVETIIDTIIATVFRPFNPLWID